MFAENELFAKGGIGIINTNIYIVLKSEKNELRFADGGKWIGHAVSEPEASFFFDGKVWSQQALPAQFDLSGAIVVSFEKERVRFFDFSKMSGGYYKRILKK